MVGIVSYGAYIPKYRIDRKLIYKAMGWLNPATYLPGEKAVANHDEDSLTMAVAAGIDCLGDIDRSTVDGMYFASTTVPFKERASAQIAATTFDLRTDIRAADFTDSVKAGTTAILSACDTVKAETGNNILVCASDCRSIKPGSAQEELFGEGAGSVLIGNKNVIANLVASHSVSYDFSDHWRSNSDTYDRQWEDRFVRDVGYKKFIPEAISGLMKKCKLEPKDIAKVSYPCLYAGDHKNIGRKLGLDPAQVQPHMVATVGYTGTGDPLMTLVAMLEDAKPGDKIIVASYGSGSDAILFEVTGEIDSIKAKRRGTKKYLESRRELKSYEKMASFRGALPLEKGIRGEMTPFSALSDLWRRRKAVFGLIGGKCTKCSTPQFPAQKICVNPDCGAIDKMEDYRFSDKQATLIMFTGDNLAFSPNPPQIYGTIDFDGGGRYWFDLTDVELDSVKVGMKVEMSFRKKYTDEKFGIHGYFWKAVPVLS